MGVHYPITGVGGRGGVWGGAQCLYIGLYLVNQIGYGKSGSC
jgi:hypothetical protein